ncbi:MAG: DUF4249 domain-containing protein [Bacteroidales bacterium]|nr:DUF4249 domain-containing protein [Bacteroidales bacterium]
MKRFLRILVTVMPLVVALVSCDDRRYLPEAEHKLVVEGWIEDGKPPMVFVSGTMPAADKISIVDAIRYNYTTAQVFLSDGENIYPLNCDIDTSYFPFSKYIDYTGTVKGEPGKEYAIYVKYFDDVAVASSVMPRTARFDSLRSVESGNAAGKYKIMGYLTNSVTDSLYYKVFVKVRGKDSAHTASLLATLDGTLKDGVNNIMISKAHRIPNTDLTLTFERGDTVDIKLCTVDKFNFGYWQTFDEISGFGQTPLLVTPDNMPSSFGEGIVGYWGAYGLSEYTLVAGEDWNNE